MTFGPLGGAHLLAAAGFGAVFAGATFFTLLAIALGAALLGPIYARFGFPVMNAVAAVAVALSLSVLLLACRGEREHRAA